MERIQPLRLYDNSNDISRKLNDNVSDATNSDDKIRNNNKEKNEDNDDLCNLYGHHDNSMTDFVNAEYLNSVIDECVIKVFIKV